VDIYRQKKRWKWVLFGVAVAIVSISLYYTNILVGEIRKNERKNVQIWADAIHRKADLVNFTNKLFQQIREEERSRVLLFAEAQNRILTATNNEDLNFYLNIMENNTSIPVILTDKDGNIKTARNLTINLDSVPKLVGELKRQFSVYPPIVVNYTNTYDYFYYKDSNIFTELKRVLDDLLQSFFSEVVLNSASVPVIITDHTQKKVIAFGNIPQKKMADSAYVEKILSSMSRQNKPIRVDLADTGTRYIFYQDSFLLTQLRYYPFVQLAVISLFLLIAYLLFSYARKSEQNQVWVGMAKETAHQLGTPLSSMVAWVELLKLKGIDQETVSEIEKDVQRLETVTERFSKIGSAAQLEMTNVVKVIDDMISYIRSRISAKVNFILTPAPPAEVVIPLNMQLFEWVIENLLKNAVDAMEGNGTIHIDITQDVDHIHIDVSDTGKGIPKSRYKTIFNPGFTSKQRGWGLGLTLSRRIIENYHSGKIYVKSSAINKGTTFRIILKK